MVPMETTVLQLTVPPEMQGELLGACGTLGLGSSSSDRCRWQS
jgi:hypothetical protein